MCYHFKFVLSNTCVFTYFILLFISYMLVYKGFFKDQVWTKVDQFVELLTQKLRSPLELMPG
jgi:hypothetical protein